MTQTALLRRLLPNGGSCTGKTKNGTRCRALSIFENGMCIHHGGEGVRAISIIRQHAKTLYRRQYAMGEIRKALPYLQDDAFRAQLEVMLTQWEAAQRLTPQRIHYLKGRTA